MVTQLRGFSTFCLYQDIWHSGVPLHLSQKGKVGLGRLVICGNIQLFLPCYHLKKKEKQFGRRDNTHNTIIPTPKFSFFKNLITAIIWLKPFCILHFPPTYLYTAFPFKWLYRYSPCYFPICISVLIFWWIRDSGIIESFYTYSFLFPLHLADLPRIVVSRFEYFLLLLLPNCLKTFV